MFRCDRCGEAFYEPNRQTFRENLDGEDGWWTYTEAYCPHCGSQDFEEAREDDEEDDE